MNDDDRNKITIAILPVFMMLAMAISTATVHAADNTAAALNKLLTGDHRSAENKARDQYRHPVETLTFFGIKPDMTVVEIFPGGGWYTEILAPFLKDEGKYYAAGTDPDSSSKFAREAAKRFKEKMDADEIYSKVNITVLAPPDKATIAPAGTADMVLTFRNIHNWMGGGYADDVFNAMYKALKPGGTLGVVEHRGNPKIPQDPEAGSGYVNQDHAIKLAEKAGFKFVASSEVNANPRDTKDYKKGVWTLPPTFTLKDKDRDKYLAIGESDRFTLKFIKPVQ